MRTLIIAFGLLSVPLLDLFAGRLDIAVIQFPGVYEAGVLEGALSRVALSEITDADRTRTSESALKGGSVIFAQSLPLSPGGSFATSTRLKNLRADVDGRLGSGNLSATITITEGVKAGIRNFEKRVYSGNGPLSAGAPQIISVRSVKVRTTSAIRGQQKKEVLEYTTVIVAQYAP